MVFLGIEISHDTQGVALSQRKYALDLLQEARLLTCKADIDLWDESGPIFEDVTQYTRLVAKLIYLTITRPDIIYVIGLVSSYAQT